MQFWDEKWITLTARVAHRAFPILTLGCCDTQVLVPPEPCYLVGRYGEIEHAIDNLDNPLQVSDYMY